MALASMEPANLVFAAQPSLVGIERVEFLRGPTALFAGQSAGFSSLVGGTVNFVPKRAQSKDVNTLTAGFQSDSVGFVQFDIGRRFGREDEWGLRVGGEVLGGDTQVNFGDREQRAIAVAVDYNTGQFRAALDVRYNENEQGGHTREIFSASNGPVPTDFDASFNPNQPWGFINTDSLLGALRLEYDVVPNTMIFGAASGSLNGEQSITGFPSNLQPNGDFTTNTGDFQTDAERLNFEGGIRSEFETGAITHNFVAAANWGFQSERFDFVGFDPNDAFTNNIFNPVVVPNPGVRSTLPENDTARNTYVGATLLDTLGFFEDRLQLTLGIRYQDLRIRNLDGMTGDKLSESTGDNFSPGFGLLYRISDRISIYANYLEGLSNGGAAPAFAVNAGQQLGPIASDSIEIGSKFDIGEFSVDIALFQIRDVSTAVDPDTNIFGEVGEERIRGLEISTFGELAQGIRLIGGLTVFDDEITASDVAANIGDPIPGIPDFVVSANMEYDISDTGLTVIAQFRHQGTADIVLGNDLTIPSWTTLGFGARFSFDKFVARINVENVGNETYFNGSPFGELALGTPRTVLASLTAAF
ncbi:TonB-dependent receptor [Eilatimonas milleporae]|uniref:TonB-dependent receptor n=1 Tax=Eilatimonas milleporae TaxID=911205 RepID=UPI000EF9A6EE|nr:TonB-dependent siderophore receptor [Eilatimonas milleporae]